MLKKLLFSTLTILLAYSIAIVGYKANEPDKSMLTVSEFEDKNSGLDYDTLMQYTLSSGSSAIHYFVFYSENDDNSKYLQYNVLNPLEKDTNSRFQDLLEYVDVTDLENRPNTNQLKEEWHVSSTPALIACKVEDDHILIENALEWTAKKPLNEINVKQWLIKNGLYVNSQDDEIIAEPLQ